MSGGGRSQIKCAVISCADKSTVCTLAGPHGSWQHDRFPFPRSAGAMVALCPLAEHPPLLSQKESRARRKGPRADILESRVMAVAAFAPGPLVSPTNVQSSSAGSQCPENIFIAAGYADGLLR